MLNFIRLDWIVCRDGHQPPNDWFVPVRFLAEKVLGSSHPRLLQRLPTHRQYLEETVGKPGHCLWVGACRRRWRWEALNTCLVEKQTSTNHWFMPISNSFSKIEALIISWCSLWNGQYITISGRQHHFWHSMWNTNMKIQEKRYRAWSPGGSVPVVLVWTK